MISIYLIVVFWFIFLIYWFISAIGSKKTIRGVSWWKGAGIRVLILIIVFLFFKSQIFLGLTKYNPTITSNPLIRSIGVILCGSGIAFAIWARVHLGRNWGMPMSVKENPELVTTGPYSFVRHPIYTGMIFATLGTLLVNGIWLLIIFVIVVAYFIYSAKQEEKLMLKQFPKQYPEYKKKTKMLIPLVF